MKLRWIFIFLMLSIFGITMIIACSYNGDVSLNLTDSFRMLSPDLDNRMRACSEINDLDEDNPNKEKKK
jgi:hypothetical protein